ncbi:hypothetical protein EDB85DRAFT_1891932 [Lactarius pseudohatsudake]|nr:hypothetical protein EDB85DRAFT_1891932 [Lactarius pseudohatsudake]
MAWPLARRRRSRLALRRDLRAVLSRCCGGILCSVDTASWHCGGLHAVVMASWCRIVMVSQRDVMTDLARCDRMAVVAGSRRKVDVATTGLRAVRRKWGLEGAGKAEKAQASAAVALADTQKERWTRVEARKKAMSPQDGLSRSQNTVAAADATTSDAVTTSATGNSSPVTEGTTEDELPSGLDGAVCRVLTGRTTSCGTRAPAAGRAAREGARMGASSSAAWWVLQEWWWQVWELRERGAKKGLMLGSEFETNPTDQRAGLPDAEKVNFFKDPSLGSRNHGPAPPWREGRVEEWNRGLRNIEVYRNKGYNGDETEREGAVLTAAEVFFLVPKLARVGNSRSTGILAVAERKESLARQGLAVTSRAGQSKPIVLNPGGRCSSVEGREVGTSHLAMTGTTPGDSARRHLKTQGQGKTHRKLHIARLKRLSERHGCRFSWKDRSVDETEDGGTAAKGGDRVMDSGSGSSVANSSNPADSESCSAFWA